MNLLSTYIAAKGLKEMSKHSGRGGSYGGNEYAVVKPSKESIEKVLTEQKDNVALANYVKNLHTSTWDHCDKGRRKTADEKVQRIVLRHCRENGMTKEQQREVEKVAKENMNPVKPWKRVDGLSVRNLNMNIRLVVVPDNFTLQQMQYLCACMKEYGMDTLVLAKESGKEAHIMTFNGHRSYVTPQAEYILSNNAFPREKLDITFASMGDTFCRAYTSSAKYLEIHLNTKENAHIDIDLLKKTVEEMSKVNFHHSAYCPSIIADTSPKIEDPETILGESDDVLNDSTSSTNSGNEYSAEMTAGNDVLEGTEQINIAETDSIDNIEVDER